MEKAMRQLREFTSAFNHYEATTPGSLPPAEVRLLRARLVLEEAIEFCNGCGFTVQVGQRDVGPKSFDLVRNSSGASLVEMFDALLDGLYVHFGSLLSLGVLDPQEGFDEVHRSNMAKLGPDGLQLRDEYGKTTKPEGWRPPDLQGVLDRLRQRRGQE